MEQGSHLTFSYLISEIDIRSSTKENKKIKSKYFTINKHASYLRIPENYNRYLYFSVW